MKSPFSSRAKDEELSSSATPDAQESVPQPDLSTTLDAFESRIQLRKTAKRVAESEAEKTQKIRQKLLLTSMMNIRRSLAQLTKIDLGDNFSLTLDADDWQGWPRLLVRLEDLSDPRKEYPAFQVVAHDRLERAQVEIAQTNIPKTEKLSLIDQGDLARLPAVLKRSVRSYLDLVEKAVVEAETRWNSEAHAPPIVAAQLSEPEVTETPALSGDIFIDDADMISDLDELPVLDQLEALPLGGGKLNLD